MNQIMSEQLEKLKLILGELGFSDASIAEQLEKLSTLIIIATMNKIADARPVAIDANQVPDEEMIIKYLKENFDDKQLKDIFLEVSEEKITLYLSEVLGGVDQAKREEILSKF